LSNEEGAAIQPKCKLQKINLSDSIFDDINLYADKQKRLIPAADYFTLKAS
jgi:hypothetical protein